VIVKFNIDHYELQLDLDEAKSYLGLDNYSLVGGWYLPKLYLNALDVLAQKNNTTLAGDVLASVPISKSVYGKNVFKVNDYLFNFLGIPVKKDTLINKTYAGTMSNNYINLPDNIQLSPGDNLSTITLPDIFIYSVNNNETTVLQW
jgi:hypothetical protein